MKVLSVPYTSNNPYQDNLSASLEKLGVTVINDIKFKTSILAVLKALFRQENIRIVHFHWLDPFIKNNNHLKLVFKNICFLFEVMIIRLTGKKIIWTVHNLLPHDIEDEKLLLFSTGLFARLTNGIITHSGNAGALVSKKFNVQLKKIHVVPHGNYINNYKNTVSKSQARKKLDIPDEKFTMLFIGRVRPYKGVEKLVDAIDRLNDNNTHLLIAGVFSDNRYSKNLFASVENNPQVTVHKGFVPADELQYYMNAADVVVLPYSSILTSGAAILAMSFGKAVIAPALGELKELINNRGGILYDPADPQGIDKAVRNARHADLEAMGTHNLEQAGMLNWDSVATATKNVYQSCLKQLPGHVTGH